jgi:hypothetical protein
MNVESEKLYEEELFSLDYVAEGWFRHNLELLLLQVLH